MPDHHLPDDVGDLDGPGDLLTRLRPPPPRTWRDRLDDLAADPPSPGRVALAVVAVAVVALVGWRVLTPPPAPPELELPLAPPAAQGAGAADPQIPLPGEQPDAPQGGSGVPGGAGGDAGTAGAGSTAPATEVVVHVVGAVLSPGVQRLPTGSRVIDAVEAAGGAAPDADLSRVNLAAVLVDGQQVVVLRPGEAPPVATGAGPAVSGGVGGAGGEADGAPIDINRASMAELEELPGIGPATAEAIVAHRDRHGPFASVDDLIDVRGIGEAKLEQLRDRATV